MAGNTSFIVISIEQTQNNTLGPCCSHHSRTVVEFITSCQVSRPQLVACACAGDGVTTLLKNIGVPLAHQTSPAYLN